MAGLFRDADNGQTLYVVAPLPGVLVSLHDQKVDTKNKRVQSSLKVKTEPREINTTADIANGLSNTLEQQGEDESDTSKSGDSAKSSRNQDQSSLRRYECEHCSRIFPYLSELTKHKTIHSDERPFHCDQCGKSFKRANALKEHRFTHTKAKPYHCPTCKRAFGRVSDVNRHKRVHFKKSLPSELVPELHLLKDMLLSTGKQPLQLELVELSSLRESNGKILHVQQQASQSNPIHSGLTQLVHPEDQQSVESLCIQSTKSCTHSENDPVEYNRVDLSCARIDEDSTTSVALEKPLHYSSASNTENESAGPALMGQYPFMKVQATSLFGHHNDGQKITNIEGEDTQSSDVNFQKDLAVILTVENQFVSSPFSVTRNVPCENGHEPSADIQWEGLTAGSGKHSVEQPSGAELRIVREQRLECDTDEVQAVSHSHDTDNTHKRQFLSQQNNALTASVSSATSVENPGLIPGELSDTYLSQIKQSEFTHKQTPTAELFACSECEESFTDWTSFKTHLSTVKHLGRFSCDQCDRSFLYRDCLNRHIRLHTDNPRFYCDICDKIFEKKSELERHLSTHSDKRPFKCKQCGKRFKQAGYLKDHSRIHTGEKRFKCDQCEKSFHRSYDLNCHARLVHSEEKAFVCEQCVLRFHSHRELMSHQHLHTRNQFYCCRQCNSRFTDSSALTDHLREHHLCRIVTK